MYSNESTAGPKPQFEMGKLDGSLTQNLADSLDREGEDRFCRFVDHMPPVSCSSSDPVTQADEQKPEGMVRLFDRGVGTSTVQWLMVGLLLCPWIRCDPHRASSIQDYQCGQIPRLPWAQPSLLLHPYISHHRPWPTIRHYLLHPHQSLPP
jgi:hypothetical protein